VVSAVAMRGRTTTSTQQRLRAQDDRAAHKEADAVRRREEALANKAEEEATATMESLKAFGETPLARVACCPATRCRTVGGPTHLYAWPFPHKGRCLGWRACPTKGCC
jgi:hypothetical protein